MFAKPQDAHWAEKGWQLSKRPLRKHKPYPVPLVIPAPAKLQKNPNLLSPSPPLPNLAPPAPRRILTPH